MTDVSTKKRLIRLAFVALLAAGALTWIKPVIVGALAQRHAASDTVGMVTLTSADSPATVASSDALVAEAAPATPETKAMERDHTFQVAYKRGYNEYVRGDTLTIENGSYVVRDNSTGMPETVGVFPLAAVDSVVLLSHQVDSAAVETPVR